MKIEMLTITQAVGNRLETLHPVMLVMEDAVLLIDAGYPGSLPLLQEAAARCCIPLNRLTGLVLTHHDIDHMGGAFEIVQACPGIKVYATSGEAPYINGKKKSLRLRQAEDLYASLPDEYKRAALAFQQALKALKPIPVDIILEDNDRPFGHDIQILLTPGHTPGHCSLYLEKEKVLIAADAVVVENEALEIPNPQFTLDLQHAIASVKRLSQLAVSRIICYHGGWVETGIDKKFQELMGKYV